MKRSVNGTGQSRLNLIKVSLLKLFCAVDGWNKRCMKVRILLGWVSVFLIDLYSSWNGLKIVLKYNTNVWLLMAARLSRGKVWSIRQKKNLEKPRMELKQYGHCFFFQKYRESCVKADIRKTFKMAARRMEWIRFFTSWTKHSLIGVRQIIGNGFSVFLKFWLPVNCNLPWEFLLFPKTT